MAQLLYRLEPPRVVCAKCVRIARVHYCDAEMMFDGIVIAVECCERIYGFLAWDKIDGARRGISDLTTKDIDCRQVELEALAAEAQQRADRWKGRADAIRWAMQ